MANKGNTLQTKRLNAPRVAVLPNRKVNKFLSTARPGPHKKDESVSLTVVMRDTLNLAQNSKECKKILNTNDVLIDGRRVTDHKRAVGLMDVITIPTQSVFKNVYISKGNKLRLIDINESLSKTKICKVVGKRAGKKGQIIVTLHDGKNLMTDNNVKTGDTVILSLPDNKITKLLKAETGSLCYIMKGKHVGVVAKLKELVNDGLVKLAVLESKEIGEFKTVAEYLFVLDVPERVM